MVEQTERITGLVNFGQYLTRLLTVDAIFLNEDRHTHNITVLMDEEGQYHFCPIFDNGGSLLSDITVDYPMGEDIYSLIDRVKAKTFCRDFEEQLDIMERLYGQQLRFSFGRKEIEAVLQQEQNYPSEIKERVGKVLLEQKRKYDYLF